MVKIKVFIDQDKTDKLMFNRRYVVLFHNLPQDSSSMMMPADEFEDLINKFIKQCELLGDIRCEGCIHGLHFSNDKGYCSACNKKLKNIKE